jgi:hypothetical protein
MMVVIVVIIMMMVIMIVIMMVVVVVVIMVVIVVVVMVMIHVGSHDTRQADRVMWMVVAVSTAIVCRRRSRIERHGAETSCGGNGQAYYGLTEHVEALQDTALKTIPTHRASHGFQFSFFDRLRYVSKPGHSPTFELSVSS